MSSYTVQASQNDTVVEVNFGVPAADSRDGTSSTTFLQRDVAGRARQSRNLVFGVPGNGNLFDFQGLRLEGWKCCGVA